MVHPNRSSVHFSGSRQFLFLSLRAGLSLIIEETVGTMVFELLVEDILLLKMHQKTAGIQTVEAKDLRPSLAQVSKIEKPELAAPEDLSKSVQNTSKLSGRETSENKKSVIPNQKGPANS